MGVSSHTSHKEFENGTVFPFRPTVHTHPLRKRNFLKTLFKLEEFEHAGFAFVWTESILNTEDFENNDITIIM